MFFLPGKNTEQKFQLDLTFSEGSLGWSVDFFFLSGEEELTEYILFPGAAGREGAGLPNSSLLWKRLKADTHSPNGFRGLSTESPAVLERLSRNRKPQHPRESHKDNVA